MCSWMRHQSFLMVFRLFEMPIFLPFRSDILKMSVAGTHDHAAALVDPGGPQEPGTADVGVDMDGRVEAAEADEVIEVVDVARVPVVLGCVAEVGVLDADLLELLAAPPQLLVDVVGGYHRAVGGPTPLSSSAVPWWRLCSVRHSSAPFPKIAASRYPREIPRDSSRSSSPSVSSPSHNP